MAERRRRGTRVQRAVDDACDRWARAGEAWDVLTWALARDAVFLGTPVDEGGLRRAVVLEGARSIGLPTLAALYRIGARQVLVERVRFTDARSPLTGRC